MASNRKQKHQGHRLYATKLMGNAEQIIKDFDSSKENKLKQTKILLRDRMETIRNLDKAKFNNGKHWQRVQTSETTPNKFEEFLWGARRVVHILG